MSKRNLAVLALAALIGGCGFQLRGTGTSDFALERLSVDARNSYGETTRAVREALESNGVQPGGRYSLYLAGENEQRRTASYTAAARSAEQELITTVDYQIQGPQGEPLITDRVEVRKVYVQDQNNVIGSSQEAEQLREEMRREVVQQLMLRLQYVTPAQLDKLQADAEARARAEAEAMEAARRAQDATPQSSPLQIPFGN
ncbi:LPS-assembly lipoprotein LptE [Stutzerimonas azotifigens]|uniref:LPS-assembly lipoprotein LptE n=1 Tax=Stutzerimonas azotifigens TaxID=291995 RepID=UPI0004288412|nr:LPS assembly lipoprotein LptE [Stutzerimonas azotifigens]